jgi:selenocysteine-specific elongation factor
MRVIGTAGHVDHGKSALVEALTGINPDRLKEEQERQMTIDLGFAWFDLPGGEPIGIIDVPGHRDFIDNMLAGVGGIDAALFVIAADEGVMPQTREHLAILDLLEVSRGVVALTKIDLVKDTDWIELVKEEVRQLLENTHLAASEIIEVSAVQNEGLEALSQALADCVADSPPRADLSKPRLPVDRAFSISGFGTIVTGTLIDGSFASGDEVEIMPSQVRARIRGLQTHKTQIEEAEPGSRVAANLSGVEVSQIKRGQVLTSPGDYRPTRLVDVSYRHLEGNNLELKHNQQVKVFHGSAQTVARVRLLGEKKLLPGAKGWLQLEMQQPIVAARSDHFILRRPSPGATLGGGRIIDAHPPGKHKRMDAGISTRFDKLHEGTADEILLQFVQSAGLVQNDMLDELTSLRQSEIDKALEALAESGQVLQLASTSSPGRFVVALVDWEDLVNRVRKILAQYHREQPLKAGMAREELKSRLRVDGRSFPSILAQMQEQAVISVRETDVSLHEHEIKLSKDEQERIDQLLSVFANNPFSPPSFKDSVKEIGADLLLYLIQSGQLVKVAADVVFEKRTYQSMKEKIEGALAEHGEITVAQVRDLFGTTRKYSLAMMEHLDEIGLTTRDGDVRRLA